MRAAAAIAGLALAAMPADADEFDLSTRYRLRWSEERSDQDLGQVYRLGLGARGRTPLGVHVLARATADLDGDEPLYAGLTDSRPRDPTGDLLEAWVDFHDLHGLAVARAGRQTLTETPLIAVVDGLRFESAPEGPLGLTAGGVVGRPVRRWTSAPASDALAGLMGEVRPVAGTRLRADWLHVEDRGARIRDDLFGLSGWATVLGAVQLHARHTRLGGDARDLHGRVAATWADADFTLQASYTEWLVTVRDTVLEFDPYVALTAPLAPYRDGRVAATQGLGPHLSLDASAAMRRLRRDHDLGPFNREWTRWRAGASTRDWPLAGLGASGGCDAWDGPGRLIATGYGEASVTVAYVRVAAGTDYTQWRTDTLTGREETAVRTWYAELRVRRTEGAEVRLRYAFEDADHERFHRFEVQVSWRL